MSSRFLCYLFRLRGKLFASLSVFPFLRVVAAYSCGDNDFIALFGKYLSPVFALGLPDFVPHFCFVHFFKDFCDFLRAINYDNPHLLLCIALPAFGLFLLTIDLVCRPYHLL